MVWIFLPERKKSIEFCDLRPHMSPSSRQWLSPGHTVSYLTTTWPSFPSNSCSERIHYSLAPIASMSLKIKLTHSASLLCCCNYKSGLSVCEQGKRSQQPSERAAEGLADNEGWDGRGSGASDRLRGSELLRRQVNQSGVSSAAQCTHPAMDVSGKGKIQLLLQLRKASVPLRTKVRLAFPQVAPCQ